jgi:hypothetical protein
MENNNSVNNLAEALRLKAEQEKAMGMGETPTQKTIQEKLDDPTLSPWQKFKAAQGTTRPWDMLKSEGKTTDEIAEARYNTCLGCEHLITLTKQCKKCGCFMNLKTKLAGAECPVGKWKPVDVLEEGE